MKKTSFELALILLISLSSNKQSIYPVNQVKTTYLLDAKQVVTELELLQKLVQDSPSAQWAIAVIPQFVACRKAYKKTEWLYAFLHPEDAKLLNGPPLPKLDEAALNPDMVIESKGFQGLEELLASNTAYEEKETCLKLIAELLNGTRAVPELLSYVNLNDRIVFEAAQQNLVRIAFTGITGFDSPAMNLSLAESQQSWQSVATHLGYYRDTFQKVSPKESSALFALLKSAQTYFAKHRDFDTFDRLTFIQQFADPCFRLIHQLHVATGTEQSVQISSTNMPLNYAASSLFAPDLLSPYFYARNPSLKADKKAAELGKLLFFDPILSKNNERSCSSCHQPEKGFTDGLQKSASIHGKGTVARNSPTLLNAAFATKFFMDFRVSFLEEQVEHVILDGKEFATDYTEIINKIKTSSEYKKKFDDAFGHDPNSINSGTISYSISQYVRTLTSLNSPFDQMARKERAIQAEVARGFNLFMGKAACGTCHFAPVFSGLVAPSYNDFESEVLGVTTAPKTKELDADLGRFEVYKYKNPIYKHSFKTPTVRNVTLTGPYMHNGAFATLEEVVDFYDHGGGKGMGLDVPNQTLPEDSLHLSQQEKRDLVAFMQSLTDTTHLVSKPSRLPVFENNSTLNARKTGGKY